MSCRALYLCLLFVSIVRAGGNEELRSLTMSERYFLSVALEKLNDQYRKPKEQEDLLVSALLRSTIKCLEKQATITSADVKAAWLAAEKRKMIFSRFDR